VLELHHDADMSAQLQRTLIGAYVGAADLGEAIAAASRVTPGDYGQWYEVWSHTARVALAAAEDAAARGQRPYAAGGFLRAAEYWRQAYFFLRHDLADQRVSRGYGQQREAFRKAARHLPFFVEELSISFDPAPLSGYVFRPGPEAGTGRPTVLFTGGFDSTAEENFKYGAHGAVELGWNAVVWDGPGQGGLLVDHGVPMRPDYETVLAPVVDWAVQQPYVDPRRLFLVGRSLGGYLAPRGASAEHRIAALVCDPGQFDFTSRFMSSVSTADWQRVLAADPDMDAGLERLLAEPRGREFYGSRMAAMGAPSFGEWLRTLTGYTLEGHAENITCPTLITEGEGDFASQGAVLYDALTCEKQFRKFPAATGGAGHCAGMGQQLWEQAAFSWLGDIAARGTA
jgi:alpha-beta hydrolase superfamily lysophospholipase